jgi:hypothetical protein
MAVGGLGATFWNSLEKDGELNGSLQHHLL